MKNILFPKEFRTVGWILFIPSLLAGALCYFCGIGLSGLLQTIINDVVIIGIVLGALFIVCSKEPQEDEMTKAIRLSSLLNALYAYVMVLIVGTLCINGEKYLEFMTLNFVLLPVIFVFIFRAEMYRYYKQNEDEE